jgi:hypothetical protein
LEPDLVWRMGDSWTTGGRLSGRLERAKSLDFTERLKSQYHDRAEYLRPLEVLVGAEEVWTVLRLQAGALALGCVADRGTRENGLG